MRLAIFTNGDIKKSISNIREITEGVKSLIGTGQNEVGSTGQKIRSNLDKISIAIDSLNRTLENSAAISDKMRKGDYRVARDLFEGR